MKILDILKSNKEFTERAKIAYLSAFNEKFPHRSIFMTQAWRYSMRGFITAMAFIVIFESASVYADQANVSPSNVLYPLKRSQEILNLTLTNIDERPAVHLKFAERRLWELEEVKSIDDTNSRKINSLSNDLRKEIRNSLPAIGNGDDDEISENVEASSISKSELAKKIEQTNSGKNNGKDDDEDDEDEDAFTTPSAAILASSSPDDDIEKDEPSTIGQEKIEKRSESRKLTPSESKIKPICNSFNGLINSDNNNIKEVLDDHPEFIEKFQKKCRLLIDG